jgi:hypothetical protein
MVTFELWVGGGGRGLTLVLINYIIWELLNFKHKNYF